jgi:hypothetical protein
MNLYGLKQLIDSMRTVRKNTSPGALPKCSPSLQAAFICPTNVRP